MPTDLFPQIFIEVENKKADLQNYLGIILIVFELLIEKFFCI